MVLYKNGESVTLKDYAHISAYKNLGWVESQPRDILSDEPIETAEKSVKELYSEDELMVMTTKAIKQLALELYGTEIKKITKSDVIAQFLKLQKVED